MIQYLFKRKKGNLLQDEDYLTLNDEVPRIFAYDHIIHPNILDIHFE